jgi:hypothetical protein
VPQEGISVRPSINSVRNCDRSTIKSVIVAAVLKLFLDAPTNFKSILGRHCYVARVKETVNVSSKQQAIPYLVWPSLRIWADMRGVQAGSVRSPVTAQRLP